MVVHTRHWIYENKVPVRSSGPTAKHIPYSHDDFRFEVQGTSNLIPSRDSCFLILHYTLAPFSLTMLFLTQLQSLWGLCKTQQPQIIYLFACKGNKQRLGQSFPSQILECPSIQQTAFGPDVCLNVDTHKTHKDFLGKYRLWCSVEPEINISNKLSRVLYIHPRTWPLIPWCSKDLNQKLLSNTESLSPSQSHWRCKCSSAKPLMQIHMKLEKCSIHEPVTPELGCMFIPV